MREEDEILVIEDDEDKAALLISILREQLPGRIRHIDDGGEALRFLFSEESKNTKLILLDLILPNIDGVEIFKSLKAHPSKCNIPIIILTSSSQTEDYINSLGLHPDGYAHKPNLKNCA
jgi:DNA-binding response OmpR family regulator